MQEKIDRKGKYDEKRPGGRRFHWWLLSRKIANGGKTITVAIDRTSNNHDEIQAMTII